MRQEIWDSRWQDISKANGLTLEDAAQFLGIDKNTVSTYRKRFGYTEPTPDIDGIRELAEQGFTRDEAAEKLGMSPHTVGRYARRHAIPFRHAGAKLVDERSEVMAAMYTAGRTLEDIGAVYGITRERVRQILKKYHGVSGKDGGASVVAETNRKNRRRKEEIKYLAKYGCTPEQYRAARSYASQMRNEGTPSKAPLHAFYQQQHSAKVRGIGWNIKFWDWWTLWQNSGKWAERGRRGDGYVMCRFRDDGPYEIGNVYIATLRHNSTVQPNNPYRKGHPDFEQTIAAKRQRHGHDKRVCERADCTGEHYAHGLCQRHYCQDRLANLRAQPSPDARAA